MQFDIISIFPSFFESIFKESILKRAQAAGHVSVYVHDLRQWTEDKHHSVDDRPFGGGAGMLMQLEPIYRALKALDVYPTRPEGTEVWLTSAAGEIWNQSLAQAAKPLKRIVIICGHYEGIDHRVAEHLIDREISIGEFVLTGGELPAAVIVDSITRLIPGVLGNPDSLAEESHNDDALEYPQYTRPAEFITEEGDSWKAPEVLLTGNHAAIKKWQQQNTRK